ncbi:Hypothetical protein, putative [Bodo saltans]|uniref:Uncharacterized protein n=1 Tax=Bodo saltans TaxID=75058 RepID=A0A0S4JIA2_BODSA|nr:Hypothetical protein, putative [Bodo saltans]|eukprot:CUG90066.1 Hypothetical protein, putative [Bodo saltans]
MYDEVFDGHRLRRIVLMTHMSGSTTTSGGGGGGNPSTSSLSTSSMTGNPLLLPHDVVVESFAKLKKVHQEHYMYKLLPLLCDSYMAFNALLGIVSSPGSPFRIEHRRDPGAFRMHFPAGSKHRVELCEALLQDTPKESVAEAPMHRKLPLPGNAVDFHGLLVTKAPPAAATARVVGAPPPPPQPQQQQLLSGALNLVESLSETVIREHAVMNRFVLTQMFISKFTSPHVQTFRDYYACHNRFYFLATKKPIPQEHRAALLQQAAHEKIHVYEMNAGGDFTFATATAAAAQRR